MIEFITHTVTLRYKWTGVLQNQLMSAAAQHKDPTDNTMTSVDMRQLIREYLQSLSQ
jgi:hypothetical protein